jgi:hypothetical protein
VTLPIASPIELPVQFDPIQKAWVVSSANRNLRFVRQTAMPTSPGGPPVLGFAIGLANSFLQDGRYRGRYFLRDGYHRSFGFLSQGVKEVPAFVKDISDYLDDIVSASVVQPAVHKMIVIQALELTPLG